MSEARVEIPARLGKEAQCGLNDVFPGDMIDVSLKSLASEAAQKALGGLTSDLRLAVLEAFRNGQDFMVGPIEWSIADPFEPRSLFEAVKHEVTVKAGAVASGSFGPDEIPHGWRIYRVSDWQEGKMK